MRSTRVVIVGDHCRPPYYEEIQCGRHTLIADESVGRGGLDAGPSPFDYLLCSLGACTAIALRAYCERRSWPIHRVLVTVQLREEMHALSIVRVVNILGAVTQAQRTRLTAVCERTAVTTALRRGIRIKTRIHVQPLTL